VSEGVDTAHLLAHLRGEHTDDRVAECRACGDLPPVVSTEGQRPVRQNTSHPPTGRKCGCGCGEPVARSFKPGHDARLKGRLVREARNGSEEAKQNLRDWGWERYIP
jgi:hypothetical protein